MINEHLEEALQEETTEIEEEEEEEETEEEEEEETEEEEATGILPEELIVPGELITPILSLYHLMQKTEEDIGRQLVKHRRQEGAWLGHLNKIEQATHEKVAAARLEVGIPEDNNDYELILPEETGKDGKFVKISRQGQK